jgi:hypothetical protein
VSLAGANFAGVDLAGTALVGTALVGADFAAVDFVGAGAVRADFGTVDFVGTRLAGADFVEVDFAAVDRRAVVVVDLAGDRPVPDLVELGWALLAVELEVGGFSAVRRDVIDSRTLESDPVELRAGMPAAVCLRVFELAAATRLPPVFRPGSGPAALAALSTAAPVALAAFAAPVAFAEPFVAFGITQPDCHERPPITGISGASR